ncbi:Retrovirus-related Pol polyprotein from transposon RE2-like protein [Drosera capensis]
MGRFQSFATEFRDLLPFTSDARAYAKKMDELLVIMYLHTIRPDLDSVKSFISGVLQSQVPVRSALLSSSAGHGRGGSFAPGRGGASGSGRGRQSNPGRGRGRPKCINCGKPGHWKDTCYDIVGYPSRPTAHIVASISSEDYARFLQFQYFQAQSSPSPSPSTSAALFTQSSSASPSWILDSGATDHMTGNVTYFSSLSKSSFSSAVTLADGSSSPIMGIGNINLIPTITLKSAFYVLAFPYNLISIRKLIHTLRCLVTFSSPFVYIQDSKTKAMIGTGRESYGGHYILAGSPTALTTSGDVLRTHCQLGHPSLPSLRQMRPSLSSISSLECQSCHLGKHHRVSFPVSHKRASAPFALVHSDIWGPTRVQSTFGF